MLFLYYSQAFFVLVLVLLSIDWLFVWTITKRNNGNALLLLKLLLKDN